MNEASYKQRNFQQSKSSVGLFVVALCGQISQVVRKGRKPSPARSLESFVQDLFDWHDRSFIFSMRTFDFGDMTLYQPQVNFDSKHIHKMFRFQWCRFLAASDIQHLSMPRANANDLKNKQELECIAKCFHTNLYNIHEGP